MLALLSKMKSHPHRRQHSLERSARLPEQHDIVATAAADHGFRLDHIERVTAV